MFATTPAASTFATPAKGEPALPARGERAEFVVADGSQQCDKSSKNSHRHSGNCLTASFSMEKLREVIYTPEGAGKLQTQSDLKRDDGEVRPKQPITPQNS
jgi:hypothetical protein